MSTLALPVKENLKQPRWLYIILCCIFCGLYFVRDIWHINISYYVIYAVAAIIILTVRREEAVAFFMAISSFASAGFTGVFCIMLLGCVLIRFYNYIKSVKVVSLLLVVMCLYECIHYFAARKTAIGAIIVYVTVLMALLIIQQVPSKEINKVLVVNSFIAFSLFFVLMTLIQMLDAYGSLKALLENGYRTEAYTQLRETDSLTANQNYITQLCSLNMCLCVLMISKKMPKLFYVTAIVIFLVSGFLTISKMFMVVIVAFALYIAFIALKRDTIKGIGIIALMALASFVIIRLMGDTLIAKIQYRFENEELTSGRLNTIGELLSYMKTHPLTYLLGRGILQLQGFLSANIHSSFFEIFGGWGIPGLVLATVYIVCLVRQARLESILEGHRPNGYNYLPILMLLGYTLIGMLFSSAFTVVQMMTCIYSLYIEERETNVVQHHNAGL